MGTIACRALRAKELVRQFLTIPVDSLDILLYMFLIYVVLIGCAPIS